MLTNVHLVHYGKDLEMRGLYLDTLDKIDLEIEKNPKFYPNHRYLVVWNDGARNDDEQPYYIIKNLGIHYGPRNEGFYEFTKCPYLTTRDGIIFKFIYKRYEKSITWLDEPEYTGMLAHIEAIQNKLRNAELNTGISKRTGKPWYQLKFDRLKDADDGIRAFCERKDYVKTPPQLKYTERIRTIDRIKSSFEYFLSKPDKTIFGLDYETHGGFPMIDETFEPVGIGISCCDDDAIGCYYDIQWMLHESDGSELKVFIEYLNKFLDKFENSVTYNNQFEMKVTYLFLGRLCLFDEGATVNKCDGLVKRRFSLKFTAQRVLGVPSWDDDFERLTNELLPQLWDYDEDTESYLWKKVADGVNRKMIDQKDGHSYWELVTEDTKDNTVDCYDLDGKAVRVRVPNDYKHNPIWEEIMKLFPGEESEFEHLVEKWYGDEYACIPSNIQTEYCCRDSFYTGHLKIDCMKRYRNDNLVDPDLCYLTYNHNLQLEALLHLTGFFCDEPLRQKIDTLCSCIMAYGAIHTTKWILDEMLNWYRPLNIPYVQYLSDVIKQGYDPCVSKPIILNNLSEDSESGLNETALTSLLGPEVTKIYVDTVKEYCYRIDASFSRSRKVFQVIDQQLNEYYKPEYGDDYCKYTIHGVEYTFKLNWNMLIEYYVTLSNYKKIDELSTQLMYSDIEKFQLPQLGEVKLPEKFNVTDDVTGEIWEMDYDGVIDYCDVCFNTGSKDMSPLFKFMAFNRFKGLSYNSWINGNPAVEWGTMTPLTEELRSIVEDHEFDLEWIYRKAVEYINLDIDRVKQTDSYKRYLLNNDPVRLLYQCINKETWEDEYHRRIGLFQKQVGTDSNGLPMYEWFPQIEEWMSTVADSLAGGYMDFLVRYTGFWSLSNDDKDRLSKEIDSVDVCGNSIESLAKLNACFMMLRKYSKVRSAYMRGRAFYEYNETADYFNEDGITPNRYNGKDEIHKCYLPFSANEKKSKRWSSSYHTIPSKSEMKKIVTTPPGYLMSYFDISGAEIRTISFMAQDPFMMQCYKDGKDPYITMARFTYPEETYDPSKHWDMEYEDYLKSRRGAFKQILLGSLYGMGVPMMADLAEISEDDAEAVMNALWERCPGLKRFVEEKSTWAEEHPGFVQSALGDVLELDDEDGADRLSRLGINQFIQNYASVSLADGFYNVIEKSIHHSDEKLNAKDFILRPLGVVHDSCQIYFPTKYLFEMNEYYVRNLSGYLYDLHKILYAFDLEVGTNYFDVCDLSTIDDTHIELKGTYTALSSMVDKCRADGLQFKVVSLKTAPKHGDPEDISVNGFEFGPEFKPKLPKSALRQFYDNNCYAKFNEDKSKFKMVIEKL